VSTQLVKLPRELLVMKEKHQKMENLIGKGIEWAYGNI
jgi:hypothetical protein